MMRRWVMGAALVVAACRNGPSEDQCKQLLDHLVDLEFKKAGATATSDAAKQKTAVSEAKAGEFMDTCMKKTSKTRVECALAAADLDTGVAKCDENK